MILANDVFLQTPASCGFLSRLLLIARGSCRSSCGKDCLLVGQNGLVTCSIQTSIEQRRRPKDIPNGVAHNRNKRYFGVARTCGASICMHTTNCSSSWKKTRIHGHSWFEKKLVKILRLGQPYLKTWEAAVELRLVWRTSLAYCVGPACEVLLSTTFILTWIHYEGFL